MIKFYGPNNPHGFLSNFYPAPIWVDGISAQTSEHYYQAMKSLDPVVRQQILDAATPGKSKKLGAQCVLRPDWDEVVGNRELHDIFRDGRGVVVERVKDHVMYTALICKFMQNGALRDSLLQTGEELLLEDSPTDDYWGLGSNGTGLNKLGRMLMLVRKMLPTRLP